MRKVVADHAQTTVLLGQLGVLFGRFLRIERRRNAAANVDDDALAVLVSDGERVVIVATAAGIDESLIENMRLRRQFDRSAVVDGGLDRGVVKERRNVGAKATAPLTLGRLRIGGRGTLDHVEVKAWIERRGCTLHHQHIVTVMAEVIAPLLIQQAKLAVAGADADPETLAGRERGHASAKDLHVRLSAVDVAPERGFVTDDSQQAAAPDGAIGARMHADDDVALQPDLLGGRDSICWRRMGELWRKPTTYANATEACEREAANNKT